MSNGWIIEMFKGSCPNCQHITWGMILNEEQYNSFRCMKCLNPIHYIGNEDQEEINIEYIKREMI